jgi:nucleotide-binding universal stress UspA family protein
MYEKILIPSMGEYLEETSAHVLKLVDDKETELIGLYVLETSTPLFTPQKVKEMMTEELKKRGTEVLKKMEETFKKPNIKFKGIMVEGDPAHQIIKTAEQQNTDLIIISTGKSKIDKHLLGSVSEKVIHSTPTTTLLIKTN